MRYCARCVLPENYPGIEFNEEGICNYCTNYEIKGSKGKAELDKLFNSRQKKDGRYDCLVGISGGRDSAYTLYYLVKKYGLRVLAYSADNGFVPDLAKASMRNMTEILGVDMVLERHDLMTNCVRENVSSWLTRPSPAMIPMICCGCRLGMFRGLLRQAKKRNIPTVVLGAGNSVEICHFKKAFFKVNPLGRLVSRNGKLSLLFGLVYEVAKNPRYFLNPKTFFLYVREYLYFFYFEMTQRILFPGQNILFLYDYVDWDEDEILRTIKENLNWQGGESALSSWRADCAVSFLKNYMLKKTVGFTEKTDLLCNMIRENMISRKEAEKRLDAAKEVSDDYLGEILREIGINPKKLREALQTARKINAR